jgi:hypothetical protein
MVRLKSVVVYQIVDVKNDRITSCVNSNSSNTLLGFLGRRIMNQKFGDLFQKFLIVFFIWTCIAFIFEIGY